MEHMPRMGATNGTAPGESELTQEQEGGARRSQILTSKRQVDDAHQMHRNTMLA